MGLFSRLKGGVLVAKPFNDVMEGKKQPFEVRMPSWFDGENAGDFVLMVKVALSAKNSLLAIMIDQFSFKATAAIFNAAKVLDDHNYSIEESAMLVATQICTYCKIRGVESLLEE